jgi:membrane associated rhomboid family serine protease
VIGFLPGIAWQAHVGGLIVGGAIALIYASTRRREKQRQQTALIVGLVVFLGALWVLANENLALM